MELIIMTIFVLVIIGIIVIIASDEMQQRANHKQVEDKRIAYENEITIKELL